MNENLKATLEKLHEIGALQLQSLQLNSCSGGVAGAFIGNIKEGNIYDYHLIQVLEAYLGQEEFQKNLKKRIMSDSGASESVEMSIYLDCMRVLRKLRHLELVEVFTDPDEDGSFLCRLNIKGLEVLLKLREHDDNMKRFNQQKRISITALLVSSFALIGISSNIYFSNEKLNYIMINTDINQKRLALVEEKIIQRDNIVPDLLKENITKPVDVNFQKKEINNKPQTESKPEPN